MILAFFALLFTSFINILAPLPGIQAIGLLSIITTPEKAVALAAFYFFISACIRIVLFRKDIIWSEAKKLIPLSAVGAMIGAASLFRISETTLLVIIACFSIYFLGEKISSLRHKKITLKKENKMTASATGLFSGFLQGAGFSGSDLRNNYFYAQGFSLSNVQGTTAVLGALNFFLATIIRLMWGGLKIPDLTPIFFLAPFMFIVAFGGRLVVKKIERKWGNIIAILVMSTTLLFILYKIFFLN